MTLILYTGWICQMWHPWDQTGTEPENFLNYTVCQDIMVPTHLNKPSLT